MKNISIKRCEGEEAKSYQGYVEPEDGRWRLFIDHEGFPHLLVQVTIEGEKPDDPPMKGMFNIECMMDEDARIKDLMLSTFGGHVDPSEIDEDDYKGPEFDFGPGPHDWGG